MARSPHDLMTRLWERMGGSLKEFCALGDATYLWPRWIILRAVGLVYVLVFAGILAEGQALIGPDGIAPVRGILAGYAQQYPNPVEAFLRVPSLFWLNSSAGMIATLQWLGLAAAVAVVLNVGPRVALLACWLIFLSFVSLGHFFSETAPDPLMIEVALLCIPLASPGLFPGLGAGTAPRRVAVFALRWMLFRLMLEAGLSKFVFGNALWRNFTVMDVMYETAPFPTILGYWDFQLPHVYHLLEIALTFAAEIVAPLVAVLGGRRWRWIAFFVWGALQLGIELTNNFGWLNLAAIALAVVLLDDAMIVAAVRWLRLHRLAGLLASRGATVSPRPVPPWARWGLRAALGTQFVVALFFYLVAPARIPVESIPGVIARPVVLLFGSWRSANAYPLFGSLKSTRETVQFVGSNDGGETWRSYGFRYQAQQVDRMSPFIAPWYPRFEATLQNTMLISTEPALYQAVAAHLIRRDPPVLKLFRQDPFADRPATMVRMPIYQLNFTDYPTHRATGHYWRQQYLGEYAPLMYLNEHGEIVGAN